MKIIDVLTAPWAIEAAKLQEIQEIYATHLRGEKIDIKAVEARIGKPLKNEPQGYQIVDNVAIIPVDGVIAKRANLFSSISGGASTELIGRDFQQAMNDPAVDAIILHIDSPGGSVDGTQQLAQIINGARGQGKEIVAFADGTMASAAYWIGSAADKAYIADGTTVVGSIGVISSHRDVSGAEKSMGVKTTEIYAGKYKRIASQYEPLTAEGRQSIQDQVDYLYSVFVGDVAKHRGVSEETVLTNMADGRLFFGQQAVDAGLVDGVSTMDALIAELSGRGKQKPQPKTVTMGAGVRDNQHKGDSEMDLNKLKAEHPDLYEAIKKEGFDAGAEAERERIKAVEGQTLAGHEALIASLKFDGKTTGPEAAVQVLAAEKAKKATVLGKLEADAAHAAAPHAPAPAASVTQQSAEQTPEQKWESDAAIRAEFGGNKSAYLAFVKNESRTKIKTK